MSELDELEREEDGIIAKIDKLKEDLKRNRQRQGFLGRRNLRKYIIGATVVGTVVIGLIYKAVTP